MKHLLASIFILASLSSSIVSCGKTNKTTTMENTANNGNTNNPRSTKIKITVGMDVFTATMSNNATATAFMARLPLTIKMTELNGNEKYCDIDNPLPTNASNPGTIKTGDLLLYGPYTIVLFYKAFPTPYSYTSIGHIDNASGLAAALGSGKVTVTFGAE